MEPPSGRPFSSPERSKRRPSSRPATHPNNTPKRQRGSIDQSRSPQKRSISKDPPEPLLRQTPLRPSSPRDEDQPSTMLSVPIRTSIASQGSSASGDTALADENQRQRLPDYPPRSSLTALTVPRWFPDREPHPFPTQSSSTSSSSSSHRFPPFQPTDEDRARSPGPSLTLSTGQPISNPPLKTQAAFVGKLYSMLEDEEIRRTGLIHWSSGGTTFTCPNPTEFAKQLNMYSFNKVNDLHATSTDPTAWEFRHSLFRQGEPHLLASIKRKTNRPSHPDGPQAFSPDDTGEFGRTPVAGWMADESLGPTTSSSPNTQLTPLPTAPPVHRPEVYGYNLKTGETIQSRPYDASSRTASKTYAADLARMHGLQTAPVPVPAPQQRPRVKRHHSDLDDTRGPPVSAPPSRRYPNYPPEHLPSFPSSAYADLHQYPQPAIPSPSPIMALTSQVAFLEDRIAKLSDTLSVERVDNVRSHMDMLSYVASITLWLPNAPSQDVSALQDSLSRQKADLRQRYDTLLAVDSLAHMAGGPGMESSERHFEDTIMYQHHPPSSHSTPIIRPVPIHSTHPDRLRPLHPTPGDSPILPPLISRRHTGIGLSHSTSNFANSGLLPQMPSTVHPSPSDRPSFDQPPFSRSPLMHRPASTSHLTALLGQNVAGGRRASERLTDSPEDSERRMLGDVAHSEMGEREQGGERGSVERPKSGPGAGIRNLLN